MGFDENFDDYHDGLTREAPCWSSIDMFASASFRLYLRFLLVSFSNFLSFLLCVRVRVLTYA